jgi:hypothetical protein
MTVMVVAEIQGMTTEQYDRLIEAMGFRESDPPEGLISHVAGPTEDGLLVEDVWESGEAFGRFFENGMGAASEAGVEVPQVEPRLAPVHNHIPEGQGTEPGVIVFLELEGFGPDAYDATTASMEAHAGDGSNHPSVSHVAAVTDDGLIVVDVWDSPESFGRFAEEEIGPAGEAAGLGPVEPRVVPLHNRIRGDAAA